MKTSLLLLSSFGKAQTTLNAVILGEVPIGNYNYYIAKSENKILKSAMCSPNSFSIGREVKLKLQDDETLKFINENTGEVILFQFVDARASETIPNEINSLLPTMKDDILYFANQNQLLDFQGKVNAYLKDFPESVQQIQMDKIMSRFRGFYSFNQYFIDKYDVVNYEFTEQELAVMYKVDFINDFVLKNLLNSHRVLGVGSKVHAWHSTDLILSVEISNLPKIKNNLYEVCDDNRKDPWSCTYPIFQSGVVTFSSEIISKDPHTKNVLVVDGFGENLRYQTIPTAKHIIESCNKFKKGIKMELFEETTSYGSGSNSNVPQTDYHKFNGGFDITVDWGDGTSIETYSNYNGNIIEHTYLSESDFYPIVKTTFTDANGVGRIIYDGKDAPNIGWTGILPSMPTEIKFSTSMACSVADKELSGSQTVGNYRLDAKIWVNHNVFGHHIGSYTHSWQKNKKGNWKRNRGHIYCNVSGTFRNEDCVITETKSGSDTENQERVKVTVNKIGKKYRAAGNNSIYSEHHLTNDGTYINLNLTLTPCP